MERLRVAVDKLGGTRRAAKLSGVSRSSLDYWCHVALPEKARERVEKIIELARDESKHKHFGVTTRPAWALTMLKQRKE
jgi:hypothetical protein